jgi:tetratricopeptide (TPR) repeat protein
MVMATTHRSLVLSALLAGSVVLATGVAADEGHGAHLMEGLDLHTYPITTSSKEAQRFFDQGLTLAYGFNHGEAVKFFRHSAELDPQCAMCFWGVAYALGPNINAPWDPANHPEIRKAMDRALELAPKANEREQALIKALSERYAADATAERAPLDKAYADAMRRVSLRFPKDNDAATLFAEATMDTMPWDYWTAEGEPRQGTQEFIDTLTRVLKRDPEHEGAAHFLIHAVEKTRPELGIPAADELAALPDGAPGHLIHMASHIYIRVGRYDDAVRSNERAIAADDAYAEEHGAPELYAALYMPHNHHMLWASATLDGRSKQALETADRLAERAKDQVRHPAFAVGAQHFWLTPRYAQVRFGKWDEILAWQEPDADLLYPRAVWNYARGMALARTGKLDEAQQHADALRQTVESGALDEVTYNFNPTAKLMSIASDVLTGEILAARGQTEQAVAHLEKAVATEETLVYDEPPAWHVPARHNLGAVLLEAGKPAEAEAVYRADLEVYPWNGWALTGLAKSLDAQGKKKDADQTRDRLAKAWDVADVKLEASRY